MEREEEIQYLWNEYDTVSAELVKAKRKFREGTAPESEVEILRLRLRALRLDLADRDQHVDPTEPGDVPPVMPPT